MRPHGSPWVIDLELAPPSLEDNTADAERLRQALERAGVGAPLRIAYPLLKTLPAILRQSQWQVRCIVAPRSRGASLLQVLPARDPRPVWGLAVDLGTTRVVIRLVGLAQLTVVGEAAFDNPQSRVAPDVLARIHFTDRPGGLRELQTLIIEGFNANIRRLCSESGGRPEDVWAMTLAGNTAMTHLFLGLPPQRIIREPYIPVVNRPPVIRAAELNLAIQPDAPLRVFPNVGSYFGGDLIAGVLFSGMHTREETALLVDVGTNAEVVLGNRNWLIACAGAAGPALEGGVSKIGMPAAPGVIERVRIDPDTREFRFQTIGDQPPRGICGSGVIELAAELFKAGMLDIRGKLVPEACGTRFLSHNGLHGLQVVAAEQSATGRELTLCQPDLDSLIRSKAAMYTILETLVSSVGLQLGDIETFYVAGTFGSLIDPSAAITIGMLPDLPLERFQVLGNSSLEGAAQLLLDPQRIDDIYTLRDQITYLELNVNQEFMNRFSAAKFLPHTDPDRFPSVSKDA